jgi:hypothetical protein
MVAFAFAAPAAAQAAPGDTAPRTWWRNQPTRVWVAGGLGPADYFEASGAAIRTSASLSYGRAVVMVRFLDAFDGIDGYTSTEGTGTLAGFRLGRRYLYAIPALGFGNLVWKDGHGSCSAPCAYRLEGKGLAYDLGLHATRLLGGVGLNASGFWGTAPHERVFALVLSPQLGWFGK